MHGARGHAGRFVAAALGVALVVALGAGCTTPEGGTLFPVDRGSNVDAVELDVVVGPDGSALARLDVTYADGERTALPVPAGATPIDEPIADGDRTTAGFALGPVSEGLADITVVEVPTYTSPSDASRQDPEVEVSGTVTFPEGAAPDVAQWTNGFAADVAVEGNVVRFSGEVPAWTDSELLVSGPPAMLPGLAVQDRPGAGAFQGQVAQSEAQTASLERTLDGQEQEAKLIGWVIIGVGVGVSLLMVVQLIRVNTGEARARRRLEKTFPKYLAEPPDDLPPAIVDVIDADAKRVEAEAVAGTLLDLAHRRVVGIDGYADGRFVVRVPAPPWRAAASLAASEQVLLEALRAEHPDGEVAGPPTWKPGKPSWWGHYRREVLKEATDRGLVARRFRFLFVGPFVAGIVCATWPFWLSSQVWLVPVISVALGLITIVPLKGGFTTTHAGFVAACRWRAFGRYVRDHGELADLNPAAVAVWGPYLAQAAVLGLAPRAAADLAPDGLPERTTRAERRTADEQAEAELADGGSVGPLTPPNPPAGDPAAR